MPSRPATRPAPAPEAPRESRRVLVVDDSRVQRRILVASLRRIGFEAVEAGSGQEALDIAAREPVDMILSDWMMPRMTGPEFCRAFRALELEEYGYFILLTSKGEAGAVVDGLDAGADDFLTKPVHAEELRARINAGARLLGMQRELTAKNRQITETLAELNRFYDSLNRDLAEARELQQSLMPDRHRRFGASEVSLLIRPCGQVGGDLVGVFAPSETVLGIYAIDVSGHGVSSAMMTARLSGYLHDRAHEENLALVAGDGAYGLRPPEELAQRLNARLVADTGIDQYFTMVYATIDLATGRARMVQAGHPPPLMLRSRGAVEFLGEGGPPVGLLPGVTFEGIDLTLSPGDRLILYSDGFTEARRPDGTMLEEEGMARLAMARGEGSGTAWLDGLAADLAVSTGRGGTFDDDLSAVMLSYQPLP